MSHSDTTKINHMISQGVAHDPKAIQAIKQNPNKMEGLKQASAQFETLFLQMVLKSMRSAGDALVDEDSMVSSAQTRMYRDMHDSQLTMSMANKGNLGIADAMVKQLSPMVGTEPLPQAKPATESLSTAEGENNSPAPLKSQENSVADKLQGQSAFTQPLINVVKHKSRN